LKITPPAVFLNRGFPAERWANAGIKIWDEGSTVATLPPFSEVIKKLNSSVENERSSTLNKKTGA